MEDHRFYWKTGKINDQWQSIVNYQRVAIFILECTTSGGLTVTLYLQTVNADADGY